MAALEEQLFASGLPVEALMEKAALAISRRLLHQLGTSGGGNGFAGVLVLVGPGHNGGDGLVVARELHLAGVPVRIWTPFERRKPLTEAHWSHACWLGIPVLEAAPEPADDALWIDAIFGIKQIRAAPEPLQNLLIERNRQRPSMLVAIDVPTGLCADTGEILGQGAARATRTYCIGLIKLGLVQDRALAWVGDLQRIDLGLPKTLLDALPVEQALAVGVLEADETSAPWPDLAKAAGKYERGRLLLVAGSARYRGAARLALAGASASGCGSLRASLIQDLAQSLWMVHPEVVLTPPLGTWANGALDLGGLQDDWLERLDALLLGPGIGTAASASRLELDRWQQLQAFTGLLVLDADGLNRLPALPTTTARHWLKNRAGPTWITPHAGEFARLFPDLATLPALEAAAAAADSTGADVLLKGAHSVIASADGRRWQVLGSCPEAVRTGLGDVLSGYAAGKGAMAMAARSIDAALLASAGLHHARAGFRCAHEQGAGAANPLEIAMRLGKGGTR